MQDTTTGQYYAKARYFTTNNGRWTQPEPLLKGVPSKAFLVNPQKLNPYVYCSNNPLTYVDPNGMFQAKPFAMGALQTTGGAAMAVGGVTLVAGSGATVGLSTIGGILAFKVGVWQFGEGLVKMSAAIKDQPNPDLAGQVGKAIAGKPGEIAVKGAIASVEVMTLNPSNITKGAVSATAEVISTVSAAADISSVLGIVANETTAPKVDIKESPKKGENEKNDNEEVE